MNDGREEAWIFSFTSVVIKELIPIGCSEPAQCDHSDLRKSCLLFFGDAKVLEKECTWTHDEKKQPNTWNALDESLKQTFRNFFCFVFFFRPCGIALN